MTQQQLTNCSGLTGFIDYSKDFCQDDRFEFVKNILLTHNVSTSQSSSGVYNSDSSDRAG